jgi:hypothetical protein
MNLELDVENTATVEAYDLLGNNAPALARNKHFHSSETEEHNTRMRPVSNSLVSVFEKFHSVFEIYLLMLVPQINFVSGTLSGSHDLYELIL